MDSSPAGARREASRPADPPARARRLPAMRRLAVLVPLAALAAGLLAWRRRRRLAPTLAPAVPPVPVAAPAPAPTPGFASVPWELAAAPPDDAELTVRCTLPP